MDVLVKSGSFLSIAFQNVSNQIVSFLPTFISALLIFIAGWVIASAVDEIISKFIKVLKVDNALKTIGAEEMVNRAGYELDSGAFLGAVVKFFIIVIFFLASLEILGLSQVTLLLGNLVMQVLPNLIVVIILLFAAAVLANIAKRFVMASAKASHVPTSGFLGELAKSAVWVFAILLSLIQFQIGATALNTLFLGIVVAFSLAFGLAFGLGGKDTASDLLSKWMKDMDKE